MKRKEKNINYWRHRGLFFKKKEPTNIREWEMTLHFWLYNVYDILFYRYGKIPRRTANGSIVYLPN